MKKIITLSLIALISCSSIILVAQPQSQKSFEWEGSCLVECIDGQCRQICETGIVYARSYREAKFRASARLRREASRHGKVVSGSVNISVRIRF